MAFVVDNEGNITLVQGDNGNYVISGLPTDKNYTVYFAIQDEKRRPVGNEISVQTNNESAIVFGLTADLTNLLTVNIGQATAEYYFGIKLCYPDEFIEDTLLLGNSKLGDLNTITVYPKKVEGTL